MGIGGNELVDRSAKEITKGRMINTPVPLNNVKNHIRREITTNWNIYCKQLITIALEN